jgi:hypothetical protein
MLNPLNLTMCAQVLGPNSTQQDVYMAGVKDVVEDVLKGYNGTVRFLSERVQLHLPCLQQ